ncbi:hypothetical protein M9Y10_008563 [Tritrichomonas musculus]|uniref:DM14 domain-containing protein n=1 Tax=Tritrichomonas musculus TaxID=1915356 RepID=A0ABR2IYJ0_9EUKA
MKANDLFFNTPQINEDEIDDELEHLLDEEQPQKKKKKRAKKTSSGKPQPAKQDHEQALRDAQALLQQVDDINPDDIDLDSDDIDLDAELDGLDESNPKPKKKKANFTSNISDDDDDVQKVEKPPPKAASKPEYKPTNVKYQKIEEKQTNLEYKDVFDYFSSLFYNFLYSADEPQVADQYMSVIDNLAPIIFAGPEKFDSKEVKMHFMSLPQKIVPFGHWSNIKSKALNVPSIIEENTNVRKILNDQLQKLQKLKDTANSKREEASAREIDRAIKMTNQSLKAAFPKPEFLVSDYMQLQHSTLNTSLSDKEIQVSFQSVKDCNIKGQYQIVVEIPGIGRFQSRKLSGQNNNDLNDSYNQNYDNRKIANAVSKGGKISLGDKAAQFSLSEFTNKSTVEIISNIGGTTVKFNVSLRAPLNGVSTTYEIQEFYCCPTILTEAISYTPQEVVRPSHSPNKPVKPVQVPAPAASPAPQPKKVPKNLPPPPHLVLLKKEELELFWGTKATDILADPAMIKFFKQVGYPIPKEYEDQVNFFAKKKKEFEEVQEGDLDPNIYLEDLKKALIREKDKAPSIPKEDKPIRDLLIKSLEDEIKEMESMLAEEDE